LEEKREKQQTDVSDAEEYLENTDPGEAEIFPFVWPLLKLLLREPRKGQHLREYFDDLRLCQAQDWLMLAAERGLVVRQEGPVRYKLPEEEATDETSDEGEQESKPTERSDESVETNGQVSSPSEEGEKPSDNSPTLFEESE
jgi:hypothetical protein